MIGEFAYSTAGHDKGKLYIVVGENPQTVYLCDGICHTIQSPKKKNKKHVQRVKRVVNARSSNDAVAYAIKTYKQESKNK